MSFSISVSPSQLSAADISALLTQQSALWLQADGRQLLLQDTAPAQLFADTTPECGTTSKLSSNTIRLFGKPIDGSLLYMLCQFLPTDTGVRASLLQPHPQLPVALLIELSSGLSAEQQQQLYVFASEQQIELVYLQRPVRLSEPGLLVMDMDSTAISIECIDEIAALAGVGKQVADITARAMNGELDFAASLTERVAALQGASQTVLQQVLASLPLMPGLTELVKHLQQQRWHVAIASGGFTYFTEALQQRLGLTATYANVLEIENGVLTGKVVGAIVDADAKARAVAQLAEQYAIAAEQTVAIGDGANDLPMLKTAALGVAFHAKPKVQAAVSARINQGSLLQLLYLLDPA
ncbi:phosphoserine phosphatase SerB [Arsukibacterium indicum]|uniref:Phosphoserine phosphatase SerB n=1 Tax=Arsukibacterium indicum TaxID=2848612 RepID=A0ABS6MKQ2_9GAMM|nr:phosphoserine phosphatase SerB [Arsukibacterium indicum]MBV2128876.1 phosphoserine phosphatase SerB [Arsukibacterium indicum]